MRIPPEKSPPIRLKHNDASLSDDLRFCSSIKFDEGPRWCGNPDVLKEDQVILDVKNFSRSPSKKRWACTAIKKRKIIPIIDGKESALSQEYDPTCCGEGGHWFEMIGYSQFTFSPDDKHIAFLEHNSESRVIVDDKPITDFIMSIWNLTFSQDGKHLAYFFQKDVYPAMKFVGVDGDAALPYDNVTDFRFVGDDRVRYLGHRDKTKTAVEVVCSNVKQAKHIGK